jgi:hypothetical protein
LLEQFLRHRDLGPWKIT